MRVCSGYLHTGHHRAIAFNGPPESCPVCRLIQQLSEAEAALQRERARAIELGREPQIRTVEVRRG